MLTTNYTTTITLPENYYELIVKLAEKNKMSVDNISSLLINNVLNSNYNNLFKELQCNTK